MTKEYIPREAVLKAIYTSTSPALEVKFMPAADVVEVVRCKECKHYNDRLEMYCDCVCTIRHYRDGSPIIVEENDFCSHGELKDGENDE